MLFFTLSLLITEECTFNCFSKDGFLVQLGNLPLNITLLTFAKIILICIRIVESWIFMDGGFPCLLYFEQNLTLSMCLRLFYFTSRKAGLNVLLVQGQGQLTFSFLLKFGDTQFLSFLYVLSTVHCKVSHISFTTF